MNAAPFVLCLLAALAANSRAQTNLPSLTDEHVDMVVTYDSGATPPLSFRARDDDHGGAIYQSNEVVLVVAEASQFTMPFDVPELSLTSGQTFWWLRQTLPPNGTLYLGLAAAGIPGGTFSGPLSIYVTNVVGPGRFFIWQEPNQIKVDSQNGLDATDVVTILTTGHDHLNWGFTTSGVYCVTFRAEGTLAVGGKVASLETTFVFHVRPLGVVTPYTLWQKAYWLQGTPASTNGPAADPDGDELCNAIEYASQLDPVSVTTSNRPTFTLLTDGPDTYGAWTFRRIKSVPDAIYDPVATVALNPANWEALTTQVNLVDSGPLETVTLRDHIPMSSASNRFFQYRVVLGE
ncbi:MAG: choice-of-anchor M domain-containing protein [Verrucomicrobia bacterium]|nr:choice-of-anchor M domain-containing protein [Verrucomicrobiota bacterium]